MFFYPPDSAAYVLGVPARDLSDAEFEALSPEDQVLVRAIYTETPPTPPADAEQEKD